MKDAAQQTPLPVRMRGWRSTGKTAEVLATVEIRIAGLSTVTEACPRLLRGIGDRRRACCLGWDKQECWQGLLVNPWPRHRMWWLQGCSRRGARQDLRIATNAPQHMRDGPHWTRLRSCWSLYSHGDVAGLKVSTKPAKAFERTGSASLTSCAGQKAVVAAMVKDADSKTASPRIVKVLAVGAVAATPPLTLAPCVVQRPSEVVAAAWHGGFNPVVCASQADTEV